MKIKAVLWDQRALADKTFPIKIRVTVGSKVKYFPINASVKHNQWDAKAGRVKVDTRDNAQDINNKIREMLNTIESNYLKGETISTKASSDDFYKRFENRIEYIQSKYSAAHTKRLRSVLNKIREFRPELKIKDVNHEFLKDYEMHLIKRGNCQNTIHENFVRIKTVMIEIVKEGSIEYHKNPFLNFKIKKQRVERKRLTIDQIAKMEVLPLEGNNKKARDMYMFSFYCAGVRFGDMCRLNKSNFVDGRLIYSMNKTNKSRRVKLMPQAIKIIKEYNYSFGIGTSDREITSANAMLNQSLKRVAKLIKIPDISFHTSRHSFADYAVKNKFEAHTIKDLLGHDHMATTEIYLKSFYEEESDDAMNKLFGEKK